MTDFITLQDIEKAQAKVGTPKFGPIGDIVDTRTYRRFLPEKLRRETFFERNARTVNYSLSLAVGLQSSDSLQEEAALFYDYLNNLKVWPSGRTQWVGGTSCTDENPHANYNCSFSAVNRPSVFGDAAELLMLGVGFGFRVHSRDISQLPEINCLPEIEFDEYKPKAKQDRRQENFLVQEDFAETKLYCGDTRQSWVQAIQYLVDVYFGLKGEVTKVVFNFDSIRPIGERIKGFGGTASGPEALQGILFDISEVFKECPSNRLRSIDCMDIIAASAKGIVAGSSRRSALICLFEEGDELCRNAKLGLYSNPELAKKSYRSQSNNTENLGSQYYEKVKAFALSNPELNIQHPKVKSFLSSLTPNKETLERMFESVKREGEPGFDNWPRMQLLRFYAARQTRLSYSDEEIWERYCDCGTNPCHEILLSTGVKDSYQVSFCNLSSVPLINHLIFSKASGTWGVDYKTLEQAIRLATRIGLRQTCVEMPEAHLSETQKEERLLGVSFTGLRDLMDALNWSTYEEEVKVFLSTLREWANDEADKYSDILGVPRPLLVTANKPEGTFSKIVGASNGIHYDWAPYYIQRVRMSSSDALAKSLISQGFEAVPEAYDLEKLMSKVGGTIWDKLAAFETLEKFEKEGLLSKANTVVFTFPIKSVSKTSQGEATVKEQLENINNVSTHYVDHMVSNTVTVTNDDWQDCIDWIIDNWADYTTASFLQYYAGGDYPLLPFEAINETTYQQLVAKIPEEAKAMDDKGRYFYLVNNELLTKFEQDLEDPDDVDAESVVGTCGLAGGGCSIR